MIRDIFAKVHALTNVTSGTSFPGENKLPIISSFQVQRAPGRRRRDLRQGPHRARGQDEGDADGRAVSLLLSDTSSG